MKFSRVRTCRSAGLAVAVEPATQKKFQPEFAPLSAGFAVAVAVQPAIQHEVSAGFAVAVQPTTCAS